MTIMQARNSEEHTKGLYQRRKLQLQAQFIRTQKRIESRIGERAVLKYCIRTTLEAMELHRVRTTMKLKGDIELQELQQQLAKARKQLAAVQQTIAKDRDQLQTIAKALKPRKRSVEQNEFSQNHSVQEVKMPACQPDPLQGHVVPSRESANHRNVPQPSKRELEAGMLPYLSVGLFWEIAIAACLGWLTLVLFGVVAWVVLWLLAAVFAELKR